MNPTPIDAVLDLAKQLNVGLPELAKQIKKILADESTAEAKRQRDAWFTAMALLTRNDPLVIGMWIWGDGAATRWSIPFCAELMQGSSPGACPQCGSSLTLMPHDGKAQWALTGWMQCPMGCHVTELDGDGESRLLIDVLVELRLAESKSDARRLVKGGSVKISNVQITKDNAKFGTPDQFITNNDFPLVSKWIHLRVGKEWPWMIRIVGQTEDARIRDIIDHQI